MKYLLLVFSIALIISCNNDNSGDTDPDIVTPHVETGAPANIPFTVIAQYPHDTSAFTEGLEFYDGKLYEGTGDWESSTLQIADPKTGKVLMKHKMGTDKIFGEGITIFKDKIYQLTWESNIVYVYDIKDPTKVIKTFNWPYQGWGMTHNDSNLIITDETANIYFVDPETFKVLNQISVTDNRGPVDAVNELEWVDGFIYANVFMTNRILKIDAESGRVVGQMIITNLLKPEETVAGRTDVLNGIAYNKETGTLFITGKRWPKIFELKLN